MLGGVFLNKASVFNSHIKKYAYCDIEDIYKEFSNTSNGLRLDQVDEMKRQYGDNQISGRGRDTILYRLRRAFINPFSIILFVLAIISLITDVVVAESINPTTVVIIGVMLLISGGIRFHQEMRARENQARLSTRRPFLRLL